MRARAQSGGASLNESGQTPVGDASAALVRIGAGLARIAAEAASGKAQPVQDGETPFQELVRHSATLIGSFVAVAADAARQAGLGSANGTTPAPASTGAQDAPTAPPPAQLRIAPGGCLRIPLSVDNPGTEPMAGLKPTMLAVLDASGTPTKALKAAFEPAQLNVAPHDFEKLTIILKAARTATPGSYLISFKVADDPLEVRIELGG
jgi:hypothetical protein